MARGGWAARAGGGGAQWADCAGRVQHDDWMCVWTCGVASACRAAGKRAAMGARPSFVMEERLKPHSSSLLFLSVFRLLLPTHALSLHYGWRCVPSARLPWLLAQPVWDRREGRAAAPPRTHHTDPTAAPFPPTHTHRQRSKVGHCARQSRGESQEGRPRCVRKRGSVRRGAGQRRKKGRAFVRRQRRVCLPLSLTHTSIHTTGSQLKNNAASQSIICQVCRSTFICTSTELKLKEHQSNKHDKHTFEQCFPNFGK